MHPLMIFTIRLAVLSSSVALSIIPWLISSHAVWTLALFPIWYLLCAGVISRAFYKKIPTGIILRETDEIIRSLRQAHEICWNMTKHIPFGRALVFQLIPLRWMSLRLFGYEGSIWMSLAPTIKISDPSLLNIGSSTAIENHCELQTDIPLKNECSYIEKIKLENNVTIGAHCALQAGTYIAKGSHIYPFSTIALKSHIGRHSKVSNSVYINPFCNIGTQVTIESCSHIGSRVVIADKIRIPAGSFLPPGTVLNSQDSADRVCNQHIQSLIRRRNLLSSRLSDALRAS